MKRKPLCYHNVFPMKDYPFIVVIMTMKYGILLSNRPFFNWLKIGIRLYTYIFKFTYIYVFYFTGSLSRSTTLVV